MFYNFEKIEDVKNFEMIKSKLKKILLGRFIKNINNLNVYLINDIKTLDILLKFGLTPPFYTKAYNKDIVERVINDQNIQMEVIDSIKNLNKIMWLHKNNFDFDRLVGSRVILLPNNEVRKYYVENILTPEMLLKNEKKLELILVNDDLESLLLYEKIFKLGVNKQEFYKKAFLKSSYNICKHMLFKEKCYWDEDLYLSKENFFKSQKDEYIKAKEEGRPIFEYKFNALMYDLRNDIINKDTIILNKVIEVGNNLNQKRKKRL